MPSILCLVTRLCIMTFFSPVRSIEVMDLHFILTVSTDRVHPSAVGTNTKFNQSELHDRTYDPSIPSQRHAGVVGSRPQLPVRPGEHENARVCLFTPSDP
ncbi:hypothetical protein HD554DRAFT_2119641 [Boletus coccyginus]|nr:hypothetical protein HD554DRAFT_2119641 [Boletus coccyginus]